MTGPNLDAYFARIGYRDRTDVTHATLEALHRAHTSVIPFEGLDPLLGRPVRIDLASIEDKLVRRSRGGYCFEQNALFFAVLTALGFRVTPLAARVRWMVPRDAPQTSLSHMLLFTHLPEGDFLCDVGFGGQTPTIPLRPAVALEQATPHGIYRLGTFGNGFELEMQTADGWAALYRFTLEAQSQRDYEVYNWHTSTYPHSIFVNNLIAGRVSGENRISLNNREFGVRGPDGHNERRQIETPGELHTLLAHEFGIVIEREEIERIWPRLQA